MKLQLKISGKKRIQPELDKDLVNSWKFERRPGGWVVATSTSGERVRFAYDRVKNHFHAKFSGPYNGNYFFGEKIELSSGSHASQGASDLTAQFPGKVRKILVASEAVVEAGVPLIMVEAMKMEFAIKSPLRGKVKKVLVTEGQVLSPGQQLVDFEEFEE